MRCGAWALDGCFGSELPFGTESRQFGSVGFALNKAYDTLSFLHAVLPHNYLSSNLVLH
jgi:hypothetical protein